MAKAAPAYLVTDKSPLTYKGKTAESGEIVTDLPGESIAWLLADGFIEATEAALEPEPVIEPEPVEA